MPAGPESGRWPRRHRARAGGDAGRLLRHRSLPSREPARRRGYLYTFNVNYTFILTILYVKYTFISINTITYLYSFFVGPTLLPRTCIGAMTGSAIGVGASAIGSNIGYQDVCHLGHMSSRTFVTYGHKSPNRVHKSPR